MLCTLEHSLYNILITNQLIYKNVKCLNVHSQPQLKPPQPKAGYWNRRNKKGYTTWLTVLHFC